MACGHFFLTYLYWTQSVILQALTDLPLDVIDSCDMQNFL